MLRVLHVPFTFAPDPVGGTEIYVESLARELWRFGVESAIAAPSCKGIDEAYLHNGLRVHRYQFASESKNMLRELYGLGDPEASKAFARILDEECPDIVHIHAFTRAISVLLVREAKQRGIAVIFTYHTPTVSCVRGTLMLWGKEVCDGTLLVNRCTSCSLHASGLPSWMSMCLSRAPRFVAKIIEKTNLGGGPWTVLRMAELIRRRHEAVQALMREVDGVVALREWVRTLLMRNKVPSSKIRLLPHGLVGGSKSHEPLISVEKRPLRVVFLGRADVTKGIDTLIKAVRSLPESAIVLHLYGVVQSAADHRYRIFLESLAARDSRIEFLPAVPHDKIISLLKSYHVLAVPSRWLETGPLVILESFSAGTPVIGSNLGGIAEWIHHGKNGLLVEFDDVAGWADALNKCAEDRHLLASLREGVKEPGSMRDVAQKMATMYHSFI